jgi:hypothetical protein
LGTIAGNKCDQIGRIFAQSVTDYFGQLIENYRKIPHFRATFSHD